MALIGSLIANVFFGWIAWDTHNKYLDYIEDVNESENLRKRQSRRLRSDSNPSRSNRLEDERTEFLQSGLEV